MKQQDMDTHVTVLGWLYILGNSVLLSIGAIGWFFLAGIGVLAGVDSGDPVATSIMAIIATAGLAFFGILAFARSPGWHWLAEA